MYFFLSKNHFFSGSRSSKHENAPASACCLPTPPPTLTPTAKLSEKTELPTLVASEEKADMPKGSLPPKGSSLREKMSPLLMAVVAPEEEVGGFLDRAEAGGAMIWGRAGACGGEC